MFNKPIEIDELITLANQSNYQVNGALTTEAAKITIILTFENKNYPRSASRVLGLFYKYKIKFLKFLKHLWKTASGFNHSVRCI